MNERRETVSKNLVENVVSTLGTNSKKPNTVVMAVGDEVVLEALLMYLDKKKGIERLTGLVRLELVAVYVEEEEEVETLATCEGCSKQITKEHDWKSDSEGVDLCSKCYGELLKESTEQKVTTMTDDLTEATQGDVES